MDNHQNMNEKICAALEKREGDPEAACDFAVGVLRTYDPHILAPFVNHRLFLAMMENADFLEKRNLKQISLYQKHDIKPDQWCDPVIAQHYYKYINTYDYTSLYQNKVLESAAQVMKEDYPDPQTWLDKTVTEKLDAMDRVSDTMIRTYDPDHVLNIAKDNKQYMRLAVIPYDGKDIFAQYRQSLDEVHVYAHVGLMHIDYVQPVRMQSEMWFDLYKKYMGGTGLLQQKINRSGSVMMNFENEPQDIAAIFIPVLQSPQEATRIAVHETSHRLQRHVMDYFEKDKEGATKVFGVTQYDYDLYQLSGAVYLSAQNQVDYLNNKHETLSQGCEAEIDKVLDQNESLRLPFDPT
jgi:hypothetical protein